MDERSPRDRLRAVSADPDVNRFYPASFGKAIWNAVLETRPLVMVHFGVHRGYTTIASALAMEEAGRGAVRAYDWWEDGKRDGFDEPGIARAHFDRYGVADRIVLQDLDFFDWLRRPEPCELLYLDIDNDGAKIEAMFGALEPRIRQGLRVLFEGGTEERDRHVSMTGRRPIGATRALTGYRVLVDEFPSLSIIA